VSFGKNVCFVINPSFPSLLPGGVAPAVQSHPAPAVAASGIDPGAEVTRSALL